MTAPVHALYVHGIGTEGPDFAHEASRRLRAACTARGVPYEARYVHWAPVFDGVERAFLRRMKARGSADNAVQEQVIMTFADATLYLSDAVLRARTHALVAEQMAHYYEDFVVFAHSLGCLVFTDWLRAQPKSVAERCHLFPMGCHLPMFVDQGGFRAIHGLKRWTCLWDDDDGLGWPCSGEKGFAGVVDHEVRVGVTALAHIRYWTDNSLWDETIPRLVLG